MNPIDIEKITSLDDDELDAYEINHPNRVRAAERIAADVEEEGDAMVGDRWDGLS